LSPVGEEYQRGVRAMDFGERLGQHHGVVLTQPVLEELVGTRTLMEPPVSSTREVGLNQV
jgi:hypothetical protein